MMSKEGFTKIVNFMTLGSCAKVWPYVILCNCINYFFKNLLSTWAWIKQIEYIVMMTKEGSPKIVNF